jgi:integrase
MPKKIPEISSVQVRRLTRPGLHAVGGVSGLCLQVKESGARSWILRKKIGVRRPDIGLGGFPDVTLEQARDRAREVEAQIRSGIDPIATRRDAKNALRLATAKALTFDDAAKAYFDTKSLEFKNRKHKSDWLNSVTTYASPVIGNLPIGGIELPHVIKVLQPIWSTKTETATRLRQRLEAIIAWATVSGYRAGENPARWSGNLEHVLPKAAKVKKVKHHAALPWVDVGAFMADLRRAEGMGARALEFAILTAARSGEVRGATWDELNLAEKLWTVSAERMKAGKAHRVPLSDSAVSLLKALHRFDGCPLVFPSVRGEMLSDMTLSAVMRRMKVDAVPHGFRSTFKDWARSNTNFPDEVSELALAHINNDATRAAYARDELLPKRKLLMDEWAKYCGASNE